MQEAEKPQQPSASINIQPLTGLITSEAGASATFEVSLDSPPTSPVTIALGVSDPTEGQVSPLSLTFEPAEWETPQQFTVTGQDDDYDDGDTVYFVTIGAPQSEDPTYNSLPDLPDVQVTNLDNDTAGIYAELLLGPTATTEGGGSVQVRVYLSSRPTEDVIIQLGVHPATEARVSPGQLTFQKDSNPGPEWGQTVTVTGLDDFEADGDQTFFLILFPAESADLKYNQFDPDDLTLTNLDDDTAGLLISPTDGLVTTESGMSDSFQIRLTSRPTQPVSVRLSSSDPGEGVVHPTTLNFPPDQWDIWQTVTVTGVDDYSDDGNQEYQILARAESGDPLYDGLSAVARVTNSDNDTAGITIGHATGLLTSESGTEDYFTVRLNTRPDASVRLNFSSSDPAEGEVITPMPLVITPENWHQPHQVIVAGVDDPDTPEPNDGDRVYTIQAEPAESQDDLYDGLQPEPVQVINQDNDGPRLEWILPTTNENIYNIERDRPILLQVALLDSLEKTAEVEFLWWDSLANGGEGIYVPLGSDYQASATQPGVYAIEVVPKGLHPAWNQVFAIAYDKDGDESLVKPFIWLYVDIRYPIFSPLVVIRFPGPH